jgi:hypothetical protein
MENADTPPSQVEIAVGEFYGALLMLEKINPEEALTNMQVLRNMLNEDIARLIKKLYS